MSPDASIWQVIRDYWALIGAAIGGVLWIARTEAGMKSNAKDIRGLWRQRNADIEAHKQARDETNKKIDANHAQLREDLFEQRGDIKAILQKLGK